MSVSQLEQALRLIEVNEDEGHFVGPRNESLIRQAEAALGLLFPPTYRRFLAEQGCGDIAGAEFYGIIDENFTASSVPNGIWLTLRLRDQNLLPRSLIIVSDTGDGGYYAIDKDQEDSQGESPVVLWYPGLSRSEARSEKAAEDFGVFVFQRITEALR